MPSFLSSVVMIIIAESYPALLESKEINFFSRYWSGANAFIYLNMESWLLSVLKISLFFYIFVQKTTF